jgi:diguanylate cyclase (GGDEF)-like protein
VEVQYHEAVYEMMTLDALTQTYNRRYFEDAFRREVLRAARHARPLALLLLDVDHFKQINDRYGHLVGDEVLRGLGLRLTGRTRGDELIARLGGEEFAVALPEVPLDTAARVADDFRRLVGDTPFETTRGAVRATVSIGIAYACGQQELGSTQILDMADKKLYEAKHAGRNVVKW